jgi:hypothetical protein
MQSLHARRKVAFPTLRVHLSQVFYAFGVKYSVYKSINK